MSYNHSFFLFFFLSGGKCHDLARVTKNHHYVVHGPYFDPITPPLGVLKSQSRTSTHLGSIPGGSYSTPTLESQLCSCCTRLLFWRFVHTVHPVGVPWAFVHVVHPVR